MRYPYLRFSRPIEIHPLFRGLTGEPLLLDLSDDGDFLEDLDVRDQLAWQHRIEQQLAAGGYRWGLSSYLEKRQKVLSSCPQMVREERFFHLGLDVIVPVGTPLHAPLAATVETSGYEAGDGNYGGYLLLRHASPRFETFFSLYGHLNRETLPAAGTPIPAGAPFARVGDFHENGHWFHHTHLQILTRQGLAQGYLARGYCRAADLAGIGRFCPDPLHLFCP